MKSACLLLGLLFLAPAFAQQPAAHLPRLTLEEAFNYVQVQSVSISPDGSAVVVGTRRANWQKERFDRKLWLYRNGALHPLTQSWNDHDPQWSPDGHWIAFLSDRGGADDHKGTQIYLIAVNGGEAFPVTHQEDGIHALAWSPSSQTLYFAAKKPLSKAEKEAHKKQWHDVIQFREDERGDVISRISISASIANREGVNQARTSGDEPDSVASLNEAVSDMSVSPDGTQIAFTTESSSGRIEKISDDELYVVPSAGGEPRRLTQNEASERDVQWDPDGRTLIFHVGAGSVEGKYEEVQGRIYSLDLATGRTERLGASFAGSLSEPEMLADGGEGTTGTLGTEVQIYVRQKNAEFQKAPGRLGTYSLLSTAAHSRRVAFAYSAQQTPGEVYLAESADDLREAKPITAFNALFTHRALPQGMPYTWAADDGTKIEGWLIYPPGEFGAKHLRMLTLIHGGPAAADGNHFRSDWYDWAVLAASDDWLVFRPNYRGSVGYGDTFMRQISPHLVSRPGEDILAGVDALVRDGIADPDQLTIGGYSYGGYMTNWLITQTTRFRAAVTGAGAVEHAANWGNDDLTFDDAWYLGGAPWQAEKNYNQEAALWLMNKVRTPTHMVVGGADTRVASAESYLMERELHTLGIPCKLLVFPGEGHLLTHNPWHGRIKVREELKWLDEYSREAAHLEPVARSIPDRE
jgi:dipeptidyl aminopeptidase/acylaminoacyl peptidase